MLLHTPGAFLTAVPGATWSDFKHTVLISLPRGFEVQAQAGCLTLVLQSVSGGND